MSKCAAKMCELPVRLRRNKHTCSVICAPAAAPMGELGDRLGCAATVTRWIQARRDLIDAWRHYSEDERSSGPYYSAYCAEGSIRLVVGCVHAEGIRWDVRHRTDEIEARFGPHPGGVVPGDVPSA